MIQIYYHGLSITDELPYHNIKLLTSDSFNFDANLFLPTKYKKTS